MCRFLDIIRAFPIFLSFVLGLLPLSIMANTDIQAKALAAETAFNEGRYDEAMALCDRILELNGTSGKRDLEADKFVFLMRTNYALMTSQREQMLNAALKLDTICQSVGYEPMTESQLCFEIALALLNEDCNTEESLGKAMSYITRGEKTPGDNTDSPSAAMWEYLHNIHACKIAWISPDLAATLSKLKESHRYFVEGIKLYLSNGEDSELARSFGQDAINASVALAENLSTLSEYEEALQCIEITEAAIPWIEDYPNYIDLEAYRLDALLNLRRYSQLLSKGETLINKIHENKENFTAIAIIRYEMGRAYLETHRFNEALEMLQPIFTSPYSTFLDSINMDFIKVALAEALYMTGHIEQAEEVCKQILGGNPSGYPLFRSNFIMANIAGVKNDALELGYVDDFINDFYALDDTTDDNLHFLTPQLVDYAKVYISYLQYDKALKLIDKALRAFVKNGDTLSLNYLKAVTLKGVLALHFMDREGYVESMQAYYSLAPHIRNLFNESLDNGNIPLVAECLENMSNLDVEALSLRKSLVAESERMGFLAGNDREILKAQTEFIKKNISISLNYVNSMWDKLYSDSPVELGKICENIASSYSLLGEYNTGLELIDRILPSFASVPQVYISLLFLKMEIGMMNGDFSGKEEGVELLLSALRMSLANMTSSFTLNQRNEMWLNGYNRLRDFVRFATFGRREALNGPAYDAMILSKGLLLQSEIDFHERVKRSENPQIETLYSAYRSTPVSDIESLERYEKEIIRLLERESDGGLFACDWRTVQGKLRKKEYAVEFCGLWQNDSTKYVAFVITPGWEYPKMIELPELELNVDVADYDIEQYRVLSKQIWEKFSKLIPRGSTIYFAPDMRLHAVPMEYFPDFSKKRDFIFDRWKLHRLSSTRELLREHKEPEEPKGEIYGGFNYWLSGLENPGDSVPRSLPGVHTVSRGVVPEVEYLPGSAREVTVIKNMFESAGKPVFTLMGDEGTESRFKKVAGTKGNILHISTHGFFFERPEDINPVYRKLLNLNNLRLNNFNMPLYCSGLVMTGINDILMESFYKVADDNALLTAKEISELDLSAVEMAVLSACETGSGIISPEGIFGLQRGLKLAGVKSILMSLWEVDDYATEMLMTEFYRHLLGGEPAYSALSKAQKTVRSTPGWEQPYYWAGFVLLDSIDKDVK